MSWSHLLLGGFLATVALSIILVGSQQLGWTRISLPLMVGTVVVADRDKAIAAGTGMHLVAGLGFAVIYAACFERWSLPWWAGAIGGLVHGLAVLLLLLPALPGVHPRMASEHHGPDPTAALEPPGIFATNYGRATGVFALVAHLVYGLVFGITYSW